MKIRATVICEHEGHILFVRKARSKWALPGGKVERDERPVGAAARELEEETGLSVDGLLYLQELKARDTVHHVFEASVVNIEEARPRNEIVDCHWHAYTAMDQLDTTDATRHIVKSFVRRL
ncbi:NUDIX domain-containing protein [Pseudomonas lurida]|jgi:8-oxo-dGTP diphosphatase|uniref:NUDIX domain-containing protein n=1 Tax=Pseudomonas quebecensis TaxID=2995174 RepID=A0ABY6Q8Z0_9PSED|nr:MULTISPECIES: NUDIX domain-containing protein [Pseudomonas]MBA1292771.1 NUDIX domain-containing protein [Pseudomonas lurida]MCP1510749.1 8-oxo-dGTP diphosphatase [Pseudomonas rhodesiae]MCX4067050.1 NUDIX domain-containing protein [Pseudomonas quebecensis]MDF9769563.1 8-oxo-dGTP diphosphatase [Pseudomonas rhodesiae]UZW16469.1 NUDIX domain-containing protein [Pseudomonas quebecensis]